MNRQKWPRTDKLIATAIGFFVLNLILAVAVELQVQSRNRRLDRFDTNLTLLEGEVQEVKGLTNDIKIIAEDATTSDPARTARLNEVFEKIDRICIQVEC